MQITEEQEKYLREVYKDEESLKRARELIKSTFTLEDMLNCKCIRKVDDEGNYIWVRDEIQEQ